MGSAGGNPWGKERNAWEKSFSLFLPTSGNCWCFDAAAATLQLWRNMCRWYIVYGRAERRKESGPINQLVESFTFVILSHLPCYMEGLSRNCRQRGGIRCYTHPWACGREWPLCCSRGSEHVNKGKLVSQPLWSGNVVEPWKPETQDEIPLGAYCLPLLQTESHLPGRIASARPNNGKTEPTNLVVWNRCLNYPIYLLCESFVLTVSMKTTHFPLFLKKPFFRDF